jgi:hypothetical protein
MIMRSLLRRDDKQGVLNSHKKKPLFRITFQTYDNEISPASDTRAMPELAKQ